MRYLKFALIPVAFIISGLAHAQSTSSDGFTRITTKEQYIEMVVGKSGCNDGGCGTSHADGSMTGAFGGKEWIGQWQWKGDILCRQGTVGGTSIPDDCQMIEVSKTGMRITRASGAGKAVLYMFQ